MTTWRINPTAKTNGRNSLMVETEMGIPIAEVKMQYTGSGRAVAIPDKAEQQKNAALIAVSPRMLAAMKEARAVLQTANECGVIVDTIWCHGRPETLFDFLDAAIERAEGGAA